MSFPWEENKNSTRKNAIFNTVNIVACSSYSITKRSIQRLMTLDGELLALYGFSQFHLALVLSLTIPITILKMMHACSTMIRTSLDFLDSETHSKSDRQSLNKKSIVNVYVNRFIVLIINLLYSLVQNNSYNSIYTFANWNLQTERVINFVYFPNTRDTHHSHRSSFHRLFHV